MAAPGMTAFRVVVDETDLHVQIAAGEARLEVPPGIRALALQAVHEARGMVTEEIALDRAFAAGLDPLPPRQGCPEMVRAMYDAGLRAGTGPMAAVAGAVAEFVGRALLEHTDEVIVENGGDIFLATARERTIAVHAGGSPLSGKVGIRIPAGAQLGVCTSSGAVGHSFSMGKADAAAIVAADAAYADAVATAAGNRVKCPADVEAAIEWVSGLDGIDFSTIIIGNTLGAWGTLELVRL
jgi:ApbE superfamily uncharacterized protein (UPF0280 family)